MDDEDVTGAGMTDGGDGMDKKEDEGAEVTPEIPAAGSSDETSM